jgi:hypothetical protein
MEKNCEGSNDFYSCTRISSQATGVLSMQFPFFRTPSRIVWSGLPIISLVSIMRWMRRLLSLPVRSNSSALRKIEDRALCKGRGSLAFFGDETAADGVIAASIDGLAIGTKGGKSRASGMAREGHLFIKDKLPRNKRHGVSCEQRQRARFAVAIPSSSISPGSI